MQHWEKSLRSEYQAILGEMQDTPTGPQAKYLNWNHYFSSLFPDTPAGQESLRGSRGALTAQMNQKLCSGSFGDIDYLRARLP
jgi:hypothetical protein